MCCIRKLSTKHSIQRIRFCCAHEHTTQASMQQHAGKPAAPASRLSAPSGSARRRRLYGAFAANELVQRSGAAGGCAGEQRRGRAGRRRQPRAVHHAEAFDDTLLLDGVAARRELVDLGQRRLLGPAGVLVLALELLDALVLGLLALLRGLGGGGRRRRRPGVLLAAVPAGLLLAVGHFPVAETLLGGRRLEKRRFAVGRRCGRLRDARRRRSLSGDRWARSYYDAYVTRHGEASRVR